MTTTQLTIDPRIEKWIAPLAADELVLLESSIQAEGCRDALIAWDGVLLDGHHRYKICTRLEKPFRVKSLDFPDRDHAEVWVRHNQAGRRNLTDDQRAMNAALLQEVESRIAKRERAKAGRAAGGDRKPGEDRLSAVVADKRSKKDSRTQAAKAHRVSEKRVRRAKRIKDQNQALAKKVLTGQVTIKDAERTLRNQSRTAQRSAAAAAAKLATIGETCQVQHSDFRVASSTNLADGSVALVFTDPPYHDKTLDLYQALGKVAARVLKDGGSLITYTSHHRLPDVIAMLQAAGLTFFWPLAVVHTGTKARMTEYGIVVHWKPLLWFVKGTFRSRDDLRFVNDLVESVPQKDAHPWQQSTVEARYYIEALTQPGDLVFDPFCGGGTTAVAAAQASRRWLTCDVDEQAVFIARKRIRDAMEQVA